MQRRRLVGVMLVCAISMAGALTVPGQSVSDRVVQVSTIIQADPPQITLFWPMAPGGSGYVIYRKSRDDTAWGPPLSGVLPQSAQVYVDTDVVVGKAYEYRVWRTGTSFDGSAYGYVYSGIQVPLTESRGKVVLVVDQTHASSLAVELGRLQQDLVGDGWIVLRHDVPRLAIEGANTASGFWTARSNEVAAVKALIKADYAADPTNVQAVFLFGHVPVPYSGSLAPDGHADHAGAWPADVYYGDMEGSWTDSFVNNTEGADPRNHNFPGDGKFDQTELPARVALAVGRVDMANLPVFPQDEPALLRQYLNKDHQFRHRLITARARGLVDDNLGLLNGVAPAVNGWANFSPLFGAANVSSGRWLTALAQEDYLWGYGCGGGRYSSATGVADTSDFVVYDTKVVFTMLFGSYFGDWDSENNLLRGQLATPTYTLTTAWGSRPYWHFHHMGLGETVGFGTRLTQNSPRLYDPDGPMSEVYLALMGDPALRLHPGRPPRHVLAIKNAAGAADLSWSAPAESVLGYHIYRAASLAGPFSRLNSDLISETSYTDTAATSDAYYMVRAVNLEASASGSYYNGSQGVFAQLSPGTTSTGDTTWSSGGTETWRINSATGIVGSSLGWDWLRIGGTLDLTASADQPFTVRILSLQADNSPGPVANFNKENSYTWPLATASDLISTFDPAKVQLVTTNFLSDLGGGTFRLALAGDGRSLNLIFTPNRAPLARPVTYIRGPGAVFRIDIADLLANSTSDPDGDGRLFGQVGPSTNGTTISIEGTSIVFASTNDLFETFSYSVQDVRDYRPRDTVRTASSWITIDVDPFAGINLQSVAYRAIEVEWQSEKDKFYRLQSRLGTEAKWTDDGDPIPGTGSRMSVFGRADQSAKFFRVVPVKEEASSP